MDDLLFTPIRLGRLELANRICMPAMHLNMTTNFEVTDRMLRFYEERARGGAGLIIVGYATVDLRSGSRTCLGAHDDRFIPGLTRLAAAIRSDGARAALQLNHAGRYSHRALIGNQEAVAPSAVPSRMTQETPRELTLPEIREIVAAFARAAARGQAAGFDAIELLAGTGYLISSFLSPFTNQRTDEYGGSPENRMRFGREVVRAVKAAVGEALPVLVRVNGNDFVPGGIGRTGQQDFAVELVSAGADAVHVNAGWHEARVPQINTAVPRGAFAYLIRGIKERVPVPVIGSHRINDAALARRLLAEGVCDLVAMGRPLIADPELPNKARTGRDAEILHCTACGQGCLDNVFRLRSVECLCNPRAGHEAERPLTRTVRPRRVLVVGGGPAGLVAASTAAARGHQVVLYEQEARLGGQLWLAGAPPGRGEFRQLAQDLAAQVTQHGVRTVLGTRVDEALLAREQPEVVILAGGAVPLEPTLPGAGGVPVVQAWDVLRGRAATGRRVVIVGGGSVGVETALFLAEQGTLSAEELRFLLLQEAEPVADLVALARRGSKQVTLVELKQKAGEDLGRSTRWSMLQDLERQGIRLRTATRVMELTAQGVRLEPTRATDDALSEELPADTIVLALGARPTPEFTGLTSPAGGPEIQRIGDARKVGNVLQAIHEGFLAGVRCG